MEKDYKKFSKSCRLDRQVDITFERLKHKSRQTISYVVEVGRRCEEFQDPYMAQRFFYNQLALVMRGRMDGRKVVLWQKVSDGSYLVREWAFITLPGRAVASMWMGSLAPGPDCCVCEIGIKDSIGEDDPF